MAKGRLRYNKEFNMNEVRSSVQEFIARARKQDHSTYVMITYGVEVLTDAGADRWFAIKHNTARQVEVYCVHMILNDEMRLVDPGTQGSLVNILTDNEDTLRGKEIPRGTYQFLQYIQPFLGSKIQDAIEGSVTFFCEVSLTGDITWKFSTDGDGKYITRNGEEVADLTRKPRTTSKNILIPERHWALIMSALDAAYNNVDAKDLAKTALKSDVYGEFTGEEVIDVTEYVLQGKYEIVK